VVDGDAHFHHLAHRGVAEDRRWDLEQLAAPVHAIGGAEGGGTGADEHTAGRRIQVVDVLDDERLPDRCQQGCSHRITPSSVSGNALRRIIAR